jgi:protein involved in polysaccharide export with SLBB domain
MEDLSRRTMAVLCAVMTLAVTVAAQTAGANANAIALTTRSTTLRSDLDNQHRIRPGDKLSFRVAEDREEAKPLTVTDSGEVELPSPFGRFVAAGKTCKTLADEIKVALERDYYKHATVQLGVDAMNNVRGKAYISGQIAKVGPINIPVDEPLKLSQAILIAGPPGQWAKLKEVKVVRNGQTRIVDVDAILNKGDPKNDVVLEPGDLVIVPERGVTF